MLQTSVTPPFFIGGPIPPALAPQHLHGYEDPTRELSDYLSRRSAVRIGVLGTRRAGKTSVVAAVSPGAPHPPVHLDCARIWPATPRAFLRLLAQVLGTTAPATGSNADAAQAYRDLPVPKKSTAPILVLENVDALGDIDAELIEELPILAARLPTHLVLSGPTEAVAGLVDGKVTLKPFTSSSVGDFLRRRFGPNGVILDEEAVAFAHEFTAGSPDALQRLGLAAWRILARSGGERLTRDTIDAAMVDVVDSLPSNALAPFVGLIGDTRDIFIAMCLFELTSPTEIARRVELEPKNAVVLLSRLAGTHALVERVQRGLYRVRDPLLKHYVRMTWGSPILR